jgi:membrane protein implicated in regulation of membrane protease activity
MPGERAIHVGMFILLLIGLCSLTAWVSHAYLTELILQVAAIALSWGVILLVFYVGFRALGWDWWAERTSEKQSKPDQSEN